MAWVSPTGFIDSGDVWKNETLAYDEDTASEANTDALKDAWTDYLELTHATLNCDKVQLWVNNVTANINAIEVDVYYSSTWDNIYSGAITAGTFVEYAIGSTQSVTAMRVRFYSTKATTGGCRVHEADFWEVVGPTPNAYNKILYTSEPPTPNAWNQVKQEAGTGWRKLLYT